MRDPDRHPDLETVTGDITDPQTVARLASGHDAAVHAAGDMTPTFFQSAASALIDGLGIAGVGRLIVLGLAANLRNGAGTLIRDTPEFPDQFRDFARSHAGGTDQLDHAPAGLDWAIICPSGDFDHDGTSCGQYTFSAPDMTSRITYGDLAVAVIDQIDRPTIHRKYQGAAPASL